MALPESGGLQSHTHTHTPMNTAKGAWCMGGCCAMIQWRAVGRFGKMIMKDCLIWGWVISVSGNTQG